MATKKLLDYEQKLNIVVKDGAERFTQADKDKFIQEAVTKYGRDRPRRIAEDLTGDGSKQTFATPSDWVINYSIIEELEYPVNEVPRNLLDLQDNIETFISASGVEKINTKSLTLTSGEAARITFTAPHTLTSGTSTVPDTDFDAVVNLSGAFLAWALAADYAEAIDSTIVADVVNHEGKATLFEALGNRLFKAYHSHMRGDDKEGPSAALRHQDHDILLPYKEDLIFHPQSER